ncbi:MAG: leucine--tRNA ligase [Bacteroidales bacterium]|nr:leucine--tRNA ligase [Bacteroidales bacterium]
MEYNFSEIEKKQQKFWQDQNIYKTEVDKSKPKFYVLDMFPYPSGAGLHVGHPLGYIASDIYSRYKRLNGFNVLHPMGFDAFGLPAEQYAVQTGQHPAITTDINIKRYKEQLHKIGFSYDWNREVRTADPDYYKWTQWAFLQMFHHWFNNKTQKAEHIDDLIEEFEKNGNTKIEAACGDTPKFEAAVWNGMEESEKEAILMNYRLAYRSNTKVNWCPALGTVLANDEVKDGVSERGDHPVIQKDMMQWQLRVTAYAKRLLSGLKTIDWSDSLKEMQKNWIGRSEGADVLFQIKDSEERIQVFTTRPDTVYGSTFMVIAPESELVDKVTTIENTEAADKYITRAKIRTERERMADAENITGVFSGSYAINPFTNKEIPIWIADYVLGGYGTGAIMAVPAHDSRDYAFAKHFGIEIIQVVDGGDISETSYDAKKGKLINSGIINGLEVDDAVKKIIKEIEKRNLGTRKINYRLRDAIFSRQRYWGEPFPVYYKDNIAKTLREDELPLTLPEIDDYKPTESGEPPLGRADNWLYKGKHHYELSTMPGFAGSSAYYLRYMDPQNREDLVSKEANEYWQDVDLYIGGTEHAVGHLIYARFWNKLLYDLGYIVKDEPFKKLVNQGMIQGRSNFVYRIKDTNTYVSYNLKKEYDVTEIHVDVNIVSNDILDINEFKSWRPEYENAEFILEDDDKYHCGYAIEKMSKSKYNVVNPDQIIEEYGADTLRLYEMFLGPIEQSKPWDTNGIEGVSRFLNKFWRLFFDKDGNLNISDDEPTKEEQKVIHKLIKKVSEDIERYSFNTSVSAYMVCANDLSKLKCNNREVLESFIIVLSPFAPHIADELWQIIGNKGSVVNANFPEFNKDFLSEDTITYPVAFNGKTRFTVDVPADLSKEKIEELALSDERTISRIKDCKPKKIIVVQGRMINIVL